MLVAHVFMPSIGPILLCTTDYMYRPTHAHDHVEREQMSPIAISKAEEEEVTESGGEISCCHSTSP